MSDQRPRAASVGTSLHRPSSAPGSDRVDNDDDHVNEDGSSEVTHTTDAGSAQQLLQNDNGPRMVLYGIDMVVSF